MLTSVEARKPVFSTSLPEGSFKAWIVCFSAALFFFYDFIQMNMCNALSLVLMRDFAIDATELSYLPSSFLLADVMFLFPAGLILDRMSTRKVILATLFLSVLGTFGFAIADSFSLVIMCRFISGIAHAFCFLCCILLAARWFPPSRQALVVGLVVTVAMLGGLVAQTPLALLADWIGWRQAILWDSMLGVAFLALVWWTVEDYPAHMAEHYQQKRENLKSMGFLPSLTSALGNSQNWLFGLYTGLLNLPIMLFGAVWGVLYLTQVHGVSQLEATNISSMIYLGTIVGAPVMGWLSDTWGRRRTPMIWGAVFSLGLIVAIMYGPDWSAQGLILAFFLLGLFTSSQVISYPGVTESNDTTISGTAMGLTSSIIMGIGGAAQPFTGWLLDMYWDGSMTDGVRQYADSDFLWALAVIPVGFVVALLASFLLRESYGQNS